MFLSVTEEMASSKKKKNCLVKAGKSAERDEMQTIQFSILA